MADIAVAEDDKQAALDFNSGFETETPLAPPAANPQPEPKLEVKPKAEAKPEAKAPAKVEPEVVPPKYRQITEDEWSGLQTAASKMLTPEKVKDIVTGTVGELEQRIVKKLQSATPSGMPIELPDDVVSELAADFPELAGLIRKTLEKALKGRVGTGDQPKDEKPDYEAVSKLVRDATVKAQIEALEDVHPTWREIVGAAESPDKIDASQPYRKWLATQPAEYQQKINSTNSATIIGKSIDKFLKAQEAPAPAQQKPAPKDAARIDRIKDAITPRGDGSPPSGGGANTEVDHFNAGFASG